MAQTKSIQEHLTAVCDEIEAASDRRDEEIKARITSAMQHAKQASMELKAGFESSSGQAEQHYSNALKELSQIVEDGKKAMTEAGATLQSRLQAMAQSAQSARASSEKATK